jgi:phosphoglycerate dehydrogenase-like enzyme
MVEVLLLDQDAPHYAAAIRTHHPQVTVHAAENGADAITLCASADVLVALAHLVPNDLLAAMTKLRWIQALTTGTDHLLSLPALKQDVLVTSARGIHGPQMSELAFLNMIALSRNLRGILENQDRQVWQRWPQKLLLGKTAVLVGVGAISEDLARKCGAFGMRVLGVSDSRTATAGFDAILPRARLIEAAAQADFLIVLVPYEPATHRLISRAVIASMRPSASLINLARGKVVDEPALIEALQEGRIAGAGLDVFEVEPPAPDNPLWRMDNVIITPRIGGMSDIYAQQATPLLLENLSAYISGNLKGLRNVVHR